MPTHARCRHSQQKLVGSNQHQGQVKCEECGQQLFVFHGQVDRMKAARAVEVVDPSWCLTQQRTPRTQDTGERPLVLDLDEGSVGTAAVAAAAFQQKNKTVAEPDKIHRLTNDYMLAVSQCCIQDPAASSSAAPTAVINLQQTFNGQQMMSLTQRTVATQTELVINP